MMKTLWVLMMLVVGTVMAGINNPPSGAIPKFPNGTVMDSPTGGTVRVVSGTNTSVIVTAGNIQTYAPTPPVYLADGITVKKSGTTFSVADWIPNNLTDLYTQFLVQQGATSRGLLDGPGYLFNDTNGILPALSEYYTFQTRWYDNQSSTNIGGEGVALISQWKMNDNAEDLVVADSIGANAGTSVQNTSLLTASGKINGALTFNGYSDYITMPIVASVADFTVTCWINITEETSIQHCVWALGANSTDGESQLTVDLDGRLWVGLHNSGSDYNYQRTANPIPVGEWVHLAVTRSGSDLIMYVNGQVDSDDYSFSGDPSTAITVNNNFMAGYGAWLTVQYYYGSIDDLRFYQQALTPDEIAGIYNSGSGSENAAGAVASTNEMVLVCTNKVLDFVPTATWMSVLALGTGLDTNDLQGFVSPDYGANWYQADLSATLSIDMSNTLFQGTAVYTNNLTGTNMILKAVTTSNKVVKVLGMWGPSN